MKRILIAAVIILFAGLVGAGVWGVTLLHERDSLRGELASVQATLTTTRQELATTQSSLNDTKAQLQTKTAALTDTQSQLATTKDTLASTQSTLAATQSSLADTQASLNTTRQELSDTQGELLNTKMDLAGAQASLNQADAANLQLQNTLDATQAQLTTATATLQGLGITLLSADQCTDVKLVDNATATDPTWAQLQAFLTRDRTEDHAYIANVYDCSQFSRDLHNRAEAAAIRCAEVQITFDGQYVGHAIDAFLTTDQGLVYVDDTQAPDKIAHLEAGSVYRAVSDAGFSPANLRSDVWWNNLTSNYYYIATTSGTQAVVQNIWIYW